MGDSAPNFPAPQVLESLFRLKVANDEQAAAANGELGDRLRNVYENHPDFDAKRWRLYVELLKLFEANEIKARESLRLYSAILKVAEAYMDAHGHAADLAEMAAEAGTPPEAPETPETNVVPLAGRDAPAAPKPAKGGRKAAAAAVEAAPASRKGKDPAEAETPAGGPDSGAAKDSVDAFREELRATVAEGDAHIKAVAADPPAAMPDIPPGLDRRETRERTPDPDTETHGRYRLTS